MPLIFKCLPWNHSYVAVSNLPLCGKVRSRCERCGDMRFVYYR